MGADGNTMPDGLPGPSVDTQCDEGLAGSTAMSENGGETGVPGTVVSGRPTAGGRRRERLPAVSSSQRCSYVELAWNSG